MARLKKALRLQGWKTRLTGAAVIAYVWAIALIPKALGIQNGPPVHVAIYVTGLVLMLLWIHALGRRIERKLDGRG